MKIKIYDSETNTYYEKEVDDCYFKDDEEIEEVIEITQDEINIDFDFRLSMLELGLV